jgi:hypothetical protein
MAWVTERAGAPPNDAHDAKEVQRCCPQFALVRSAGWKSSIRLPSDLCPAAVDEQLDARDET